MTERGPGGGAAGGKVVPLSEAVRQHVRPGDGIHIAYSNARPNAALLEILRQFDGTAPGFTLSASGIVSIQHALIARGLVRRVITSFAGENYPAAAPSRIFTDAVASGQVELENWSLLTLVVRLMAGALGLPFLPVRSLVGSGMEQEHLGRALALVPDPFGGDEPVAAVSSLRPDVTLVQAVAADPAGNVVMPAPYGEAYWGSLAARRSVIVCAERVLPTEELLAHNQLVTIPGHVVSAVCEVPFGSHPYGLYNPGLPGVQSHGEDYDLVTDFQAADRGGPEAVDRFLAEWVFGVRDHEGYLARLGPQRLARLRGDAAEDAWRFEPAPEDVGAPTATERMICAAADVIAARVRTADHQAILAGIGQSNLAAWIAAAELREAGRPVELMAEIGMYGYRPVPGEPFIFSQRNLPSCALLTDVQTVLGAMVGGPATRCLGVLGAGQVDATGALNSTWTADGRFLVGSGGANDIASAADEVIVTMKHSPGRLPERVPYVTSPGRRVSTIVTSEVVLERLDGEFRVTALMGDTDVDLAAASARIAAATGRELTFAREVRTLPEPTPARLSRLRAFDPRRSFLR